MNDTDWLVLSHLRSDARMALTEMSKITQIPVSTIFDKVKTHEKNHIIKHTSLVDFEKLGYHSKSLIVVKTTPERRGLLKEYLETHPNVNNLYLTNTGYDYAMETVFVNQKQTQHFIEEIERNFGIAEVKHYMILDDIHREKFLSK